MQQLFTAVHHETASFSASGCSVPDPIAITHTLSSRQAILHFFQKYPIKHLEKPWLLTI